MNEKINRKLLVFVNALIISPVLFLAFFNYPAADDFSYAINPESLNFFQIHVDKYLNWTSRYFATSVLISSPIAYGMTSYFWVYPLVFTGLFYFSIKKLLDSLKLNTPYSNHLLSLSLLSVYVLLIPSLTENFYWLAGSVTYFVPSIAFLWMIAASIDLYRNNKNKELYFLLTALFIIGGCVEILVGFAALYLFAINLYYYFQNKRIHKKLCLSMIFSGVIMLFIVLSPGNSNREEIIGTSMSLGEVLFFSLRKVATVSMRYLLIAFILFLGINKLFNIKALLHKGFHAIFLLGAMFLFIFAGTFITIYSLNIQPPPRVENVLVFTGMIFTFLIANQLNSRFEIKNSYLIPSVILAFIVQFTIPLSPFHEKSNLNLMYSDLFTAKVFKYKREVTERENLLKNCEPDCIIPPIENKPMSIFFKDFSTDPGYFINISQAKYYGLKTIRVEE